MGAFAYAKAALWQAIVFENGEFHLASLTSKENEVIEETKEFCGKVREYRRNYRDICIITEYT